jgi:hypothetical protein
MIGLFTDLLCPVSMGRVVRGTVLFMESDEKLLVGTVMKTTSFHGGAVKTGYSTGRLGIYGDALGVLGPNWAALGR